MRDIVADRTSSEILRIAEAADAVPALGTTDVVTDPGEVAGPVNGVLEQVGGGQLVRAFGQLAPHGTLVSVGHSAGEAETFPFGLMFGDAGCHGRSVVTFFPGAQVDLAADLGWLARQVEAGRIDPGIAWRGDRTRAGHAFAALTERRLGGTAVIELS